MKEYKVQHIYKQYGTQQVLNDFSLHLMQGEICCIMGESGIGKTTLLRIMMGLEDPDQGEVQQGVRVSAVFQEDRLIQELTAEANVRMVYRKRYSGMKEEIRQALLQVLPEDCLNKRVKELSGGMRRRVAVVRAMLAESDLVLMDEPFTGLDLKSKEKVIHFIRGYQKNRMIVVSTHQKEDAGFLNAKICLLTREDPSLTMIDNI